MAGFRFEVSGLELRSRNLGVRDGLDDRAEDSECVHLSCDALHAPGIWGLGSGFRGLGVRVEGRG